MTNVNDNVRISDNIGVVASSSSKQLSSIRTLSLPFFILNILFQLNFSLFGENQSWRVARDVTAPGDKDF
jgi:hypothetical protein